MFRIFFWVLGVTLVTCQITEDECTLEHDVAEMVEMIPFERIMSLSMEYAISDPQVKALLGYLSGSKFRSHMADFEASPQFAQLAEAAGLYQIDAYSLATKLNIAQVIPPAKYQVEYRRRRSPGDGIISLLKEILDIVPLADVKETYLTKLDCNPKLKSLMDRILSQDGRMFFELLFASPPLQETRKDLEGLGIPTMQILNYLKCQSNEFFDLTPKLPETSTLPDE